MIWGKWKPETRIGNLIRCIFSSSFHLQADRELQGADEGVVFTCWAFSGCLAKETALVLQISGCSFLLLSLGFLCLDISFLLSPTPCLFYFAYFSSIGWSTLRVFFWQRLAISSMVWFIFFLQQFSAMQDLVTISFSSIYCGACAFFRIAFGVLLGKVGCGLRSCVDFRFLRVYFFPPSRIRVLDFWVGGGGCTLGMVMVMAVGVENSPLSFVLRDKNIEVVVVGFFIISMVTFRPLKIVGLYLWASSWWQWGGPSEWKAVYTEAVQLSHSLPDLSTCGRERAGRGSHESIPRVDFHAAHPVLRDKSHRLTVDPECLAQAQASPLCHVARFVSDRAG